MPHIVRLQQAGMLPLGVIVCVIYPLSGVSLPGCQRGVAMPVRGEVRDALSMALKGGHGTTRDLALRSGVGITSAMYTLRNMVCAGEAVQLDPVRVSGVKRPVPVYGWAGGDDAADDGGIDWSLITCWAQWPTRG